MSRPFHIDAEWLAAERRIAQNMADRRLAILRKGRPYDLNDKRVIGLPLIEKLVPVNELARIQQRANR